MPESVYEQKDQWTVNSCQTWTGFVRGNCRKEEDCERTVFLAGFSSPCRCCLSSFLYWFHFSCHCLCVTSDGFLLSLFFPHDLQTKSENTRAENTYNFNRIEEDTFHIWSYLPHPWWVDRGQGVLPNETFLLPFMPSELGSRKESAALAAAVKDSRSQIWEL